MYGCGRSSAGVSVRSDDEIGSPPNSHRLRLWNIYTVGL